MNNDSVLRPLLLTCLCPFALGGLEVDGLTQPTKGTRPDKAAVRCKQVRDSSKRRVPGSLLCGPPKSIANATTILGPDTVELRVLVDENGKVVSANPVLGDPALYDAAVKAVRKMKFKPKRISGQLVKTELIVRYVVVRKAAAFSTKGLKREVFENGARIRYLRKDGYYIIKDAAGKIISFGRN